MILRNGTIFALSSGAGRAGVAVVRVSGPNAREALLSLAGAPLPEGRRSVLRRLREPRSGEEIDRGLLLWLPGPASYTGEDMAELHLHGGRAVVGAVLEALATVPGLRVAEPGEFTRRAFENGKFDLTAAEAVADLVDAETAAQRRQALRQMGGELGRLYEDWRAVLVGSLAYLEAEIDFSDEELPESLSAAVRSRIERLRAEITRHLDDERRGERLREGVYIAILGPPNSGKSSLLNRLAKREAAIVAETAGTTRDVIEVELDLGGYPVTLADTAGLRESGDAVESEGVRRALDRAARADLKLVLFDATYWPNVDADLLNIVDSETLVALNKRDLRPLNPPTEVAGAPAYAISCRTGEGIEAFLAALEEAVAGRLAPGETPALTRARHRAALEECGASLTRYLAACGRGADGEPPIGEELRAEDLRLAARALGRITGRVDVEDILDVVFRDFCIGK